MFKTIEEGSFTALFSISKCKVNSRISG